MRQLLQRALLLFFVLGNVWAGQAYFEKPWEAESWMRANPHIRWESMAGYGIPAWYDDSAGRASLQESLGSLSLDNIDGNAVRSAKCAAALEAARGAEANATAWTARCGANMHSASLGDVEPLACGMPAAFAFSPLTAPAVAYSPALCWLGSVAQAGRIYPCVAYGDYWRAAMSRSMDLFACSLDNASAAKKAAEGAYADAGLRGLCDSGYHGAAKEACMNASAAIASMEGGSLDGAYGGYNVLVMRAAEVRRESWNASQDMGNFSAAINLAWKDGGVIDRLAWVENQSGLARSLAEVEYKAYAFNASLAKPAVENKIAELRAGKPELISEAEGSEGLAGGVPAGTIAQRFEELDEIAKTAGERHGSAGKYLAAPYLRGYYGLAIGDMREAALLYWRAGRDADALETGMGSVVAAKKTAAADAVADAGGAVQGGPSGSEARGWLEQARGEYDAGGQSEIRGHAFDHYAKAEKYAKIAVLRAGVEEYEREVSLAALENELVALMKRGKADGLVYPGDEEEFGLLKGRNESWAMARMQALKDGMVARAASRYGYLEGWRAELQARIALAGGDVDDQLATMSIAEAGMFGAGGKLEYAKAIGGLLKLEKAYGGVDGVVNGSMGSIAGNAMQKSVSVFMDGVWLDRKSDMVVDVRLDSLKPYGAKNVPVDVDLPEEYGLMYSDITTGKENVSSVLFSGGKMKVVMKEVAPYATYRIVFAKQKALAATVKDSTKAQGLGDGSARVSRSVDFDIEVGTDAFRPPDGMKGAKVDGVGGSRMLKEGRHTLSAEYVEYGAYNISADRMRAYPIGLNSRMEYEIALLPRMDLDSAMVFIDTGEGSGSAVSGLQAYPLTGERGDAPADIAPGRHSMTVHGLRANCTTRIFVGYVIENSSAYAMARVEGLEKGNHSAKATALVGEARAAADAGNWTGALEKVAAAEEAIRKDQAEESKNLQKAAELRKEIEAEAEQLDAALAGAGADAANNSFVGKLRARRQELGKRLNASAGMAPADALAELERVDSGWLARETTAFRKAAFTEYNGLKARFSAAGNSTTPQEFLALEAALNALDASGGVEDVPGVLAGLRAAGTVAGVQEQAAQARKAQLQVALDAVKAGLNWRLAGYKKQQAAAKGTEFEGIFTHDADAIGNELKAVEKEVSKGGAGAGERLAALNDSSAGLGLFLESLERDGWRKLESAERLLNESRGTMPEGEVKSVEKKLASMRSLMAAGNYVPALRAGNAALEEIEGAGQKEDGGLLILGASAVAVLATVMVYMHKQGGLGGIGGIGLGRKEPEMRRLRGADDKAAPPEPDVPAV